MTSIDPDDAALDDGGTRARPDDQTIDVPPPGPRSSTSRKLPDVAIESATAAALADVAKAAVTPDVTAAVQKALRSQTSSPFNVLGGGAVDSAVNKALADVAKAAVTPDVTAAVQKALRSQTSSPFNVLGGGAIESAASKALAAAARDAISPSIKAALERASRARTVHWHVPDVDPALAFEVARQTGSPAPAEEEPSARAEAEPLVLPERYGKAFAGPATFFAEHEVVIDSFTALTSEFARLASKHAQLGFVWRGQQDADWGLHSSLYRRLIVHHGVKVPSAPGEVREIQNFPNEEAMLEAELAILDEAADWRMSDLSALELFARLQHHGGPTRLIDVTRNPLIASWFAVEAGDHDDRDARLFALATDSRKARSDGSLDGAALSEVLAGTRFPFWTYDTAEERTTNEWGTGTRRRIWVPPAYDARIAAQNAAFLLEGVPRTTRNSGRSHRGWAEADVRASMSVHARLLDPHRKVRATKAPAAMPLFTYRITARAKSEIRGHLTRTYGYTTSLLYPDIQGMSSRLRQNSDWLLPRTPAPVAEQ